MFYCKRILRPRRLQVKLARHDPRELVGHRARAACSIAAIRLRPRAAVTEASEFHQRMLNPDALAPSAKEINEFYNRFFYHAAELLGNERFEQIFGVPAGEPVDLVDPEIYASMATPLTR